MPIRAIRRALDDKMEELAKGLQERVIALRAPEDLYDIEGLTRASRFVIARIWTRGTSAVRRISSATSARPSGCTTSRPRRASPTAARTIPCSWPSPRATGRRPGRSPRRGPPCPWWPAIAGAATTCTSCRCRSTRRRPSGPGPILSAVTLSCNIHTGRIGAISDQFALGTPWDQVRRQASQLAIQFRNAHGDQAAGHPARGRTRIPGGLEGAPQPPRAPVRDQAAAHLRQRQRARRRCRRAARRPLGPAAGRTRSISHQWRGREAPSISLPPEERGSGRRSPDVSRDCHQARCPFRVVV